MTTLKVIEILGSSPNSWEEAAKQIVAGAAKSVKRIRSLYVNELSAVVENNKIVEYRMNGKLTFEVKNKKK